MKITAFLIVIFLLPYLIFSQDQFQFEWTVQTGSPDYDYVYDMDNDSAGNAYFFLQTPWSECHIGDTLVSGYGLYINKLNPEGSLIWTSYISCNAYIGAKILRTTPDGQSYILGMFNDTAHFGPFTLVDTASRSIYFLAKLNTDGSFDWAESLLPSPDFMAYDMEIDQDENIFITGINPGYYMLIGNDTIWGEKGGWKMPLIQCDSIGHPIWGIMTDNQSMARGMDLDIDPSGNIIIAGDFLGLKLFYGQDSIVPDNQRNLLLASITPGVGFNWLKLSGYEGTFFSYKMLVDTIGDIYVTGKMEGDFFFSTDTINIPAFYEQFGLFNFSPEGDFDWFIASTPSSNYNSWAEGHDICIDHDRNLYISGMFNQVIEIGDFTLVANPPNLYQYNFIIQVNPKGRVLMAESFYGKTYYDDYSQRKVSFCGDYLYYSGSFEGIGTFGNDQLTSYGFIDSFISKIDLLYTTVPETPPEGQTDPGIYSHYGKINIRKLEEEKAYVVEILNLAGQLVYHSEIKGVTETSFCLNQVDGLYLVSIQSGWERRTAKILLIN